MKAHAPLLALQKLRALRISVVRQSLQEATRTAARRAAMTHSVRTERDTAQEAADAYIPTALRDREGEQEQGAFFASLALGHHAALRDVATLDQRHDRLLAREEEAAAERAELVDAHQALERQLHALEALVVRQRRAALTRQEMADESAIQDVFAGRKPDGTT